VDLGLVDKSKGDGFDIVTDGDGLRVEVRALDIVNAADILVSLEALTDDCVEDEPTAVVFIVVVRSVAVEPPNTLNNDELEVAVEVWILDADGELLDVVNAADLLVSLEELADTCDGNELKGVVVMVVRSVTVELTTTLNGGIENGVEEVMLVADGDTLDIVNAADLLVSVVWLA
jgi:hypothetical protein